MQQGGSLEWIAEVEWVLLCLVEIFDVHWDKTFEEEHLLRIAEGEKKHMLHNRNKPNINSVGVPNLREHLHQCVLHSWVFDQLKSFRGL